jgi:hypothetical protein
MGAAKAAEEGNQRIDKKKNAREAHRENVISVAGVVISVTAGFRVGAFLS